MKKIVIIIPILLILSFCIYLIFYPQNSQKDQIINKEYQNEKIEICPTQKEVDKSPGKYSNVKCIVTFDDQITKQKVELAIDFSKKIKYLYKTQNMEALSNILPYPLYINNYKKRNIKIESKEEFLKLDKEIIINQEILDAIDKNPLFWNYQGFMLGAGHIWFSVNNEISNVTFNLE